MLVPVPPQSVLEAFGVDSSHLRRVAGGSGCTFASHDAMLKPVLDADESSWIADVLDGVVEEGFRLARPMRALDGAWVVEGWSAWERIAGAHDLRTRWPDVISLCRRLNAALQGVERSTVLDALESPFAIADRVAWDERSVDLPPAAVPLYWRLRAGVHDERPKSQLVHGDLSGNVLFATGLDPGVIDFSPYWRPPAYAVAIVVVDALAWHHASTSLVRQLDPQETRMLGRATLFRLAIAALSCAGDPRALERELACFARVAQILEDAS